MAQDAGKTTLDQAEDVNKGLGEAARYTSIGAAQRDKLKDNPGFYTRAWRRLRKDRIAIISLVLLAAIVIFALAAPLIEQWTGHTYQKTNLRAALLPPGALFTDPRTGETTRFWLGTDGAGRDILVRLAYGGRVSLKVAGLALIFTWMIGFAVGAVAGYFGGVIDNILMRFVDTLMCVPSITLLLLISVWIQPGSTGLAVVIALISWTGLSRLARGEVLALKRRDYIDAARVLGASDTSIILKHLLPNIVSIMIVWASLSLPSLIIYEATLSYLGFGVQMPEPSWGNMLNDAREVFRRSWTFTFFPGLAITMTALFINLLGNGLRDALDPRLNE